MYNSKYISIKEIANEIKEGRLFKDIPFDTIVRYAVQAMKLIVAEKYLVTLPALIDIKAYKGALPCGYEFPLSITKYESDQGLFIPMHSNTDNFATQYQTTGKPTNSFYTYSTNNDVLFTNFEEGKVFMVYKAIPVDDDGYPMIPDNVNVQLTVENYIRYRYLKNMASEERIVQQQLQDAQQEYTWYVGKAQAAATNMTLDEMETFSNAMSQLFVDPSQFKERLEFLGNQEFLRLK